MGPGDGVVNLKPTNVFVENILESGFLIFR